jgi:hypothetical protein
MKLRNHPQAFENIPLNRILESDFRFKEQVLYQVQLESGPISLVR